MKVRTAPLASLVLLDGWEQLDIAVRLVHVDSRDLEDTPEPQVRTTIDH